MIFWLSVARLSVTLAKSSFPENSGKSLAGFYGRFQPGIHMTRDCGCWLRLNYENDKN